MVFVKKSHRNIVALLLSLLLVVLCGTPAQAAQAQVQYETLAPISISYVSEQLQVSGPRQGDTLDYVTIEEAIGILREGLENRQEEIMIPVATTSIDNQLPLDVLNAALAHTGVPTQGDYLQWHLGKVRYGRGDGGYGDGEQYYYPLVYTVEYYTNAAQEAQVDAAVETLLDQLDVYDASDYDKVCAIYDYLCENVTYDHAGLAAGDSKLIYTAYAALINGTSVCQGYANLFYRLALELNVDARLIPGIGNGGDHGWNIVKLDGKYYNLDATWDATRAQGGREYTYFLRCQDNFSDHARKAEYDTEAFHSAYPMDTADFVPVTGPVLGDIDGSGKVNSDDVIHLLLYVSMPNLFPINAEADFTGDGSVTSDDVIRLLLHVSMPSLFPL